VTLLGKSQICRKQLGHVIFETQKDRDLAPVKRALATVEILLPRLNQQSQVWHTSDTTVSRERDHVTQAGGRAEDETMGEGTDICEGSGEGTKGCSTEEKEGQSAGIDFCCVPYVPSVLVYSCAVGLRNRDERDG
jgi:hypothetical protein